MHFVIYIAAMIKVTCTYRHINVLTYATHITAGHYRRRNNTW